MKSKLSMLIILLGLLILSSCAPSPQIFGVIEGHVTIGPLSPVVRDGEPEPTPNPEVYAAREVIIYKIDGKTEFARIRIDGNGNYRADLPIGIYIVDINHQGMDFSKDLPAEITIVEGQTTTLDINIDTGIR